MLEPAKFIVMWATSNVEAALKSLKSKEAGRVRVALRLSRRGAVVRRRSVLYALAERAQWLEEMGVDRQTAASMLMAEFNLRVEEHMRRVSAMFNTVVFTAAMTFLMAIVMSMLAVLSPDAVTYATAFATLALFIGFMLEGLAEPVRPWDYRITALAALPAALALFWFPAVYATAPAAAAYGLWYWRLRREAEEEFRMALRGRLQVASTPLAREALELMKTIRSSGAFFLQSMGDHIARIVEHYYSSIRFAGLVRALVVVSLVLIGVMAVTTLQKPLAEMVEKAKSGGAAGFPLNLYVPEYRQMVLVFGLVAAVIAGRMAESFAAVPLFTPVMLLALAV
ncbi:MAG: hypothetical protein QXS00_07910 [Pyrobaculum sp.]